MDELDAAIESRRLNRPDAHGHLQRPEEAIEVVGRGFGGLSVRVGPIVVGPLEVLRAQGQRLEITMAFQRHDVAGGVQWKFGDGDLGMQSTNDRAFSRIVIHEDQRVETDVQLLGDPSEIGALIIPVGHEAGDVAETQDHLRVVLEHLAGDRVSVLAANSQDHAAVAKALDISLERDERLAFRVALAEPDASQAVVADHPSPERVVQVQDQAFPGVTELRQDQGCQAVSVIHQMFGRTGHLGMVIKSFVTPLPPPPRGR